MDGEDEVPTESDGVGDTETVGVMEMVGVSDTLEVALGDGVTEGYNTMFQLRAKLPPPLPKPSTNK